MKTLMLSVAMAAALFAPAAYADDDDRRFCGNVPIADWMSETALRERVTAMGIDVREIDIDDGCYEVEGRNRDGRRLEILFHPQTGEQVRIDGDD